MINARRRIATWIPLPLAVAQLGAVASIAMFGPAMGMATVVSTLFLLACVVSSGGFAALTLAVSQVSEFAEIGEITVFVLKWAVSLAMLGFTIARFSIQRRSFDLRLGAVEKVALIFALWCAICSLFALHKLTSLTEAARIAVYPMLVVIVRETLTTRRDILFALAGYALAAILGAAYSYHGLGEGLQRFAGFSGNANAFGLVQSFIIPVLLSAAWVCRGFLLRLGFAAVASLSIVALALSWSRSSLLSVMVQGVAMCVLLRKFKLLIAGAVLSSLLMAAILITPATRNMLFTALRLQSGATHRTIIWEAGVDGAIRSPAFGYGFGLQVGDVVSRVRWGDWGEAFVFRSFDAPFYPHNLYIFVLLTAGTPGLVIFLTLVATMCRQHFRAGQFATSERLRIANYTILSMIIGSLFNGFFEGVALIGKGAINNYFWVAVGIVAAYEKIERSEMEPEQS